MADDSVPGDASGAARSLAGTIFILLAAKYPKPEIERET
jgi:hypothetical protein